MTLRSRRRSSTQTVFRITLLSTTSYVIFIQGYELMLALLPGLSSTYFYVYNGCVRTDPKSTPGVNRKGRRKSNTTGKRWMNGMKRHTGETGSARARVHRIFSHVLSSANTAVSADTASAGVHLILIETRVTQMIEQQRRSLYGIYYM